MKTNTKYTHILLDADNTLFDFNAAERLAVNALMKAHGFRPSRKYVRLYHEINDGWWKRLERGEVTLEQLQQRRFEQFTETVGMDGDPADINSEYKGNLGRFGTVLMPGALAFVKRLSRSHHLYIVTNGLASTQHQRFDRSPVLEYVDRLFISEEVGISKPEPEYFDYVVDAIGAPREQMLIVGDSLTSDIKGGAASGIDTCWYNRRRKPTGDIVPTYQAHSYRAIMRICAKRTK